MGNRRNRRQVILKKTFGIRNERSIGVRASNIENSEPEDEDNPIRASKTKDLKHPAKPLFRSESDVNITMHSDEEFDMEEDYHMVTGANRQLRRQILRNAQFLYDTTGSHASQVTSTAKKTQFDPNN